MPTFRQYVTRSRDLLQARPRGWKSLLYNTAMAKAKRVGPLMLPVHISIEPTNVCNLRCPVCETGNGSMQRTPGMLDVHLYKRFIDEIAPHTAVLMYYFMGEPFLNKRAYEMIRYARQKDIYVETCSNGDYVDPAGVIYSDINQISIQIGGMTQRGEAQVIGATVPLSEMFGYSTDLRSATQGRATYTMQFAMYQEVPTNVANEIVKRVRGE